ncbi:CaiB/BaiF CoA transferase family protein [Elioraea rosea]|uniref:CaiB/BaiF CoA transferase family protein n=1 Tax=Elioraea rosea TaxID=2492390 RepID=UPI00118415C7|nr:CaiB/BaiF CoA-transferase family protein [Elioraea rosea]
MTAPKPLQGLTVLTLEQAVAAPFLSCKLADAGARVIKIERPEGDFARGYDDYAKGMSSYFVWLNRGKESLVADIKKPEDAALLHAILAKADVFIQNLAPGAAARAGFGSAELRAKYPRLVTVDISGYGEEGEYAQMKAYDLLVQAETALCSVTGRAEGPGRVGASVCDIACGMAAYAGVLEALLQRGISGKGAGLAVSLFDGMADWMNVPLLTYEGTGRAPPRIGLAHPSVAPYGAFTLADGGQVLISIQNEREWVSFCREVIRDPGFATDERFASNVARVRNRAALDARIAAEFASLDRAGITARLNGAGTAYGFVNEVADFSRHPALRRVSVATPGGEVAYAAPPVRWAEGARDYGPVPAIGQHSAAIRAEFGG